jgi:hypothetical protein
MVPPLRLLTAALTLALASTASAQSLNVDLGINTVFPLPSSTYGAAAGQPGTWNGVSAQTPPPPPAALVGLSGSATSVTLSFTGGDGNFAFDNPMTNGDDDSFMDDAQDVGAAGIGTSTWTFNGLANGTYVVYTYAWAPDMATYRTNVSVAGSSDPMQTVGGAWPNGFSLGVTHALHHVTVTSGSISVTVATAGSPSDGFGTLNGFQVKSTGSPFTANCFGDGTGGACPCGNTGTLGRGCQNSVATGGARMTGSGNPSLSSDTVVLSTIGELPTALTVFIQGDVAVAPATFGDGLRCAGGTLKRLFVKSASGGAASAPGGGDPTISARAAALGAPIAPGSTRHYLINYRDSSPTFCPDPPGYTFNSSNGLTVQWN